MLVDYKLKLVWNGIACLINLTITIILYESTWKVHFIVADGWGGHFM